MLFLLVVQATWQVMSAHGKLALGLVNSAQILDEARLIRHVLAVEIGNGVAGRDWEVVEDELHLRAFRGTAFACSTQPGEGWAVAVSGLRTVDTRKDSVLVLMTDGSWRSAALTRRRQPRDLPCQEVPGFTPELWFLEPEQPGAVAAVYYERGAYRFSDAAFRYRRGTTSWQPVAEVRLANEGEVLSERTDSGLDVTLTWESQGLAQVDFGWTFRGAR